MTRYIILQITGDDADVAAAINDITGYAALTAERTSTEIDQPTIEESDQMAWVTVSATGGQWYAEAGVGRGAAKALERSAAPGINPTDALDALEAELARTWADVRRLREEAGDHG